LPRSAFGALPRTKVCPAVMTPPSPESTVARSVQILETNPFEGVKGWIRRPRSARRPLRAARIGLLDHMGGGNLGDDTTQTALIASIRQRWPAATIYGFSMNPPDTERRHGIRAFAIRRKTWDHPDRSPRKATPVSKRPTSRLNAAPALKWIKKVASHTLHIVDSVLGESVFLLRSFRAAREIDVLVMSGGGQLLDSWDGPWAYPYTLWKWVVLAKLSGARCYFINLGAGPIRHGLSQFFIRNALRLADYVSLRDEESRALVASIGFAGRAHVFPDCVYGLDPRRLEAGRTEVDSTDVIGLSPMAYCHPQRYWIRDGTVHEEFIEKFVSFGMRLDRRYRLALFSTDIWFDSDTLAAVDDRLRKSPRPPELLLGIQRVSSLDELIATMSKLDYIITCRFHGAIFAHLMNIPFIAISHHPKVRSLMVDLGLADFCLDIDTFDEELLAATFARLVKERTRIKMQLADKATDYRKRLVTQLDILFPPEFRHEQTI
jgi:polysaccharide pyruvyl transferase WcaK-like protein